MTMEMKYLILTADDFGYCNERDEGIRNLFETSKITFSSLLVNMPNSKSARNASDQNFELGLHLNLTEGKPISSPDQISSLIDPQTGEFYGKFGIRRVLELGQIKMDEVELEVIAQIREFERLVGKPPCNVNGHNHVHVFPELVSTLTKVFRKMGVTSIRIPIENELERKYPWMKGPQLQFLSSVSKYAEEAKPIYEKAGIRSNQWFLGLGLMGSFATLERIDQAFQQLKPGVTEYMTHPGLRQKEGGDDFSRSADRELEMNILQSPEFAQLLQKHNITLISWKDVPKVLSNHA
jgi:predicted glycoside hydrolase/deacetylase ChbG (UPF0249 family)